MSKRQLYPFPRLMPSDIAWQEWSATVDGESIEVDDIADHWDANSLISFEISARIDGEAMRALGITAPTLAVMVSCAETAYSVSIDAPVGASGEAVAVKAEVSIAGCDVSQVVDLRADVIGKDSSEPWLRRRILAEGPRLRVPLESDLIGFPTSSSSFDRRGLPAAPWRIHVAADSLDAPFVHSVRLELNEDYPAIRRLIGGRPDAATDAELSASITRVLIATVSRLSDGDEVRLEDIAAEHPDSITAAAQRAAEQRASSTLSEAVNHYRLRPERLEYNIASRQRILRGGP